VSKQRIFISGGAGFIGSKLVKKLLSVSNTREIMVFDNLHPQVHGLEAVPPSLPTNVKFVKGDVADRNSFREALTDFAPEIVFHLAAETGTGQSYDEPTRYCAVNVLGTTHLIDAIRNCTSVRRVVLAASRAVYGEGAYRDAEDNRFAGLPRRPETMQTGDFQVRLPANAKPPFFPALSNAELPPAPASVYASTKLMQEYLLTQAGEGASWEATILRFQNVYGPGQSLRNPYTGVLSIFAQQLLAGGTLAIFEDGEIARDFVFVDDVVEALALAGKCLIPHGTVIDIGSGEAITILEVARTLMRSLGIEDTAFEITGKFRVGDIRHACADISLANQLLGWSPRVNAAEGLNKLATWARSEYGQSTSGGLVKPP
jgi:dTDP-L-rhamnose 4-epimerase